MLRELIEFVHVYIHQKLRSQVSERESFARTRRSEARDYVLDEVAGIPIMNR